MSNDPNDELRPEDWQDEEFKGDVASAISRAKARARARQLKALNTKSNEDQMKQLMDAKLKAKEEIERMASSKNAGSGISTIQQISTVNQPSSQMMGAQNVPSQGKFALIFFELDNLVLDNYNRKMATYLEIGWDKNSIHDFITKKENIYGKIASFNTNTVSFTASSRRNRYYEVYNRSDMLDLDAAFPNVIDAINNLSQHFSVFIISERTDDLAPKTLEVMGKLGFPMDKIKVYFKKMHEVMASYKKNAVLDITSNYPSGAAIILNPDDNGIFSSLNYTTIGYTTIRNVEDFSGVTTVVCVDWASVIQALKQQ